jgi:hypothetical protein
VPTSASTPAFERWVNVQNATVVTRYRFVQSSADVTTSNQMQYKETLRVRFNIDPAKRFTVNVGAFSGAGFISSWNNLGPGTGTFNGHDAYVKQLFVAATPWKWLELQAGGLYLKTLENTEITSFDDDGYMSGERVIVRRPKELYVDELSVTRGSLGPLTTPNLWARWRDDIGVGYTQVAVAKRVTSRIAASLDYTDQAGVGTVRAALAVRFDQGVPIAGLRYEQYHRSSSHAASGFALVAERPITKWMRLQGGYATIDEFYGGWNADRIQRGRRVFATSTLRIAGPLSASIFATRALASTYSISNRVRFDAALTWDVLAQVRRKPA